MALNVGQGELKIKITLDGSHIAGQLRRMAQRLLDFADEFESEHEGDL